MALTNDERTNKKKNPPFEERNPLPPQKKEHLPHHNLWRVKSSVSLLLLLLLLDIAYFAGLAHRCCVGCSNQSINQNAFQQQQLGLCLALSK